MSNESSELTTDFQVLVEAELGQQAPYTLRRCVEETLQQFLLDLDGHHTNNIYDMVLNEVEPSILTVVMRYAGQNQSRAAEMLGLNRGTLRKKLKQYDLL